MHVYFDQQIPISTLRYALLVMGFCFLPHLTASPWWLSLLAVFSISYRLAASYWSYPVPSRWIRALLAITLLLLLRWHYGAFLSVGFFIGLLVAFFWLKLVELYRLRDLLLVILISFYVIFTSLIVHTNLWVFLYVIVAVFLNVSLLMKVQRPATTVVQLSKKSIVSLLIALPLSIAMFFLFPRITTPLWMVNISPSGQTAFSDAMSPGSLASLRPDDSTVMRVTFNNPDKAGVKIYWKGLALSHFDGVTWSETKKKYFIYLPLENLSTKEEADYEILLEPHEKEWLFYTQMPIAGWPKLQYSSNTGLTRLDGKKIYHRLAYALTSVTPQFKPLNRLLIRQNLQLPSQTNPQLRAWAENEMSEARGNTAQLTQQIANYINQHPFWYKLEPKSIGKDKAQLDRFWFQTREGYCEHYASAVAFIYRAAGVPARVMLGYFGGEWNPESNYLNVRQKDAHAWIEYWQKDKGWVRFDPTATIAPHRIDNTIREEDERNLAMYNNWSEYRSTIPWVQIMQLRYESFKFFWERWLLFYNQDRQEELLKSFKLGNWDWGKLLLLWIGTLLFVLVIGGIFYQWRLRQQDPLTREYTRLKRELKRLNIITNPPASLSKQLHALGEKYPVLKPTVSEFLAAYDALRFKKPYNETSDNNYAALLLIRRLRKKINRVNAGNNKS